MNSKICRRNSNTNLSDAESVAVVASQQNHQSQHITASHQSCSVLNGKVVSRQSGLGLVL